MRAFGLSETGPVRHMNEDCFVSAEDLRLFVVADGMGGHAAGEVAAKLAVESIENFIRRSHETTDFSWPYGIDPTLSYEANRLKTAVSLANRRIHRMAENHDDYLGMGTTVVCALVAHGQLVDRARRRQPPVPLPRRRARAAHRRRLVGGDRARQPQWQHRAAGNPARADQRPRRAPRDAGPPARTRARRRRDAAALQRRPPRFGAARDAARRADRRTRTCRRSRNHSSPPRSNTAAATTSRRWSCAAPGSRATSDGRRRSQHTAEIARTDRPLPGASSGSAAARWASSTARATKRWVARSRSRS